MIPQTSCQCFPSGELTLVAAPGEGTFSLGKEVGAQEAQRRSGGAPHLLSLRQ